MRDYWASEVYLSTIMAGWSSVSITVNGLWSAKRHPATIYKL